MGSLVPGKALLASLSGVASGAFRQRWDNAITVLVLTSFFYAYAQFYLLPPKREPGYDQFFIAPQALDGLTNVKRRKRRTRNIGQRSKQSGNDVIIFWGSQSGNAARLARQLARELRGVHGIAATAEDLGMYDAVSLASVPAGSVVGFIVSTFGEGDPPDNATELHDYLSKWHDASGRDTEKALATLRYFAFGLGDSKYQYYNRFVDCLDDALSAAGAQRLASVGKLDEATRSDESWLSWKAELIDLLQECVPRKAAAGVESMYEPELELTEATNVALPRSSGIAAHLAVLATNNTNAHAATISAIRVLSGQACLSSRTYLHVEFDISQTCSHLTYRTGDHVAVWAPNSDAEVKRLARLFGWDDQTLASPVYINAKSEASDISGLPGIPISRDALLRFYLDISGPASREAAAVLEHFAPAGQTRRRIRHLLSDEDVWDSQVVANRLTIAGLMEYVEPQKEMTWPSDLFALLLQVLPRLRSRYFSIASSPLVTENKLAITVGVVAEDLPNGGQFHGLASHYLWEHRKPPPVTTSLSTPSLDWRMSVSGANATEERGKVLLSIRPSGFKPPRDSSRPVILIAAGSGIAPFLAFTLERETLHKSGRDVGHTVLFFGCRSEKQDYLYSEVWSRLRQYDFFDSYVAFSRAGRRKEYVQHLLEQRGKDVQRMILEGSAACYICGSVKMAAEVKEVLVTLLADSLGGVNRAREHLDRMKGARSLQEDVWA